MSQEIKSGDSPAERLLSIDALRGFDMFWIIGGDQLFRRLAALGDSNRTGWIGEQLRHVEWEGFHFYDLIFPLFLFLVGVVLPYSLGKLRERGEPPARIYGRVLRRTVLLFALGLLCNDILRFDWPALRVAGVLQRIALCYGLGAVIFLTTGVRARLAAVVAILLGYWALLALVSAPGTHAGDFSKEGNVAGYVDRHYLPGKIYKAYYGNGDNEGLLSTIPAVATTLLGVLAGDWLRSRRPPGRKALGLATAGLACLTAGTVWADVFPVIKNLWTSSFVLVAGGWSLLLLALFYAVIDVFRWRAWAFPLVVIGANAITIYVAQRIVGFERIADFFVGGAARHAGLYGPILAAAGTLAVKWLFLFYLYRKRIFLRV
jgi:predicted acyltransferase